MFRHVVPVAVRAQTVLEYILCCSDRSLGPSLVFELAENTCRKDLQIVPVEIRLNCAAVGTPRVLSLLGFVVFVVGIAEKLQVESGYCDAGARLQGRKAKVGNPREPFETLGAFVDR